MIFPLPQWHHRRARRGTSCLTALTPTKTTNAHTARLKTTSGRTAQNSKRKRKWTLKVIKSPNVQLIQNVPPTAKCWRGAGANLRPKRNRQDSANTEASEDEGTPTKIEKTTTSASSQSNSKKPYSKN